MDRKLSALLALVILLACPPRTAAQDVDRDGIPDALEAELAQRFVPLLRSYQLSGYFELGFGLPKLIYRAYYPTKNGIAYPDMLVLTFEVLFNKDYGAHTPVGQDNGGHDGDNEPFMIFLKYDYAIQDWRYLSISATSHWHAAVCFTKESTGDPAFLTPQFEMHPEVYVGNRKHGNHVDRNWGGCLTPLAQDNDVIRTTAGFPDEVWKAGAARLFNVGEPAAPLIENLVTVRPQWDGYQVWGFNQFQGAGIIRQALVSLNTNDWQIEGNSVPVGSWDVLNTYALCDYGLSSDAIDAGTEGGTGAISLSMLTNSTNCGWRVKSNDSWITATSTSSMFAWANDHGAVGSGPGIIAYTIAPNPGGGSRTGTITIGPRTVTVTQSATPCGFTASPGGFDFGTSAGSGAVTLTASRADCSWTASSNAIWATVTGPASGSGNATIGFTVQANTSASGRSGILTIAGLTLDVNQAGVNCSTTLQASDVVVDRAGGARSVGVSTTPASCPWTAVSNVPWTTITSGASGSGAGTVNYTVAVNLTGDARTGTLSIGGKTFTIRQDGNGAPTVTLTSPANEATFARGATVNLAASAADADGIARVEFYVDGALLASDTTSPYTAVWINVPGGRHALTARAFDGLNRAATSAPIAVNIPNLDAIVVSPAMPKVGQTASVTVTGGNPCGAVGLNFGDGTTIVYPIEALPMTRQHVWSSAATFTIIATGHGNCVGTLAQPVTVAANSAPSVSITAPAAGTNVLRPATITVSAAASDIDGIARVELYANDLLLGVATSAPYSVAWQPAAGSYSLVAIAYDSFNTGAASALVPITVTDLGTISTAPASPVTGQPTDVTVTGSSTCGALTIDYGDGVAITYALSGLPTTQSHAWASAGTKIITATGQGNCVGARAASLVVSANAPPSVAISAPAAGSAYTSATALTIAANASDSQGVARVEFYAGASLLGADTTAPYTQAWSVTSGTVNLVARAYDVYGAVTDSAPVSVTGRDVVSVTATPSFVQAGGTASITVTGSAACGAVTIDYGDGTAITYALSGLPTTQAHVYATGGSRAITATGQGNCTGQVATSLYVNYLPNITLTSPVNGNTYIGPATVPLVAAASDLDGAVTQVHFYVNGAYLTSDSTAPYTFDWVNVPAGTYALSAIAVDNAGGARASSTSYVTVADPGPSRVTSMVAPATVGVGQAATITVYGTNPCGLVYIAWGDGTGWHHAISQLPYSYAFAWSAPGTYTITATGGGNCSGQSSTTITVQ